MGADSGGDDAEEQLPQQQEEDRLASGGAPLAQSGSAAGRRAVVVRFQHTGSRPKGSWARYTPALVTIPPALPHCFACTQGAGGAGELPLGRRAAAGSSGADSLTDEAPPAGVGGRPGAALAPSSGSGGSLFDMMPRRGSNARGDSIASAAPLRPMSSHGGRVRVIVPLGAATLSASTLTCLHVCVAPAAIRHARILTQLKTYKHETQATGLSDSRRRGSAAQGALHGAGDQDDDDDGSDDDDSLEIELEDDPVTMAARAGMGAGLGGVPSGPFGSGGGGGGRGPWQPGGGAAAASTDDGGGMF